MNGCSALHLTIFGLNPVVKFGNDRLKAEFLPRAVAGDLHVAFGVTEPDAGTDTGRITTRAEPDGKGGWLVTGRKIWTTEGTRVRGGAAHRAHRPAKDTGLRGLSLFLADLDRDYVDIRAIPKVGRNAVASCEVAYDGLPVECGASSARSTRASASCSTASTPNASCWRRGVRHRRGRARPRGHLRQGPRRVRPADRRQPGDQPSARARRIQLQGRVDDGAARRSALRRRPRVRRGGQQRQVPRRRSRVLRRRPRRCRPSAAWATRPSTTSSATGAKPASRASPPSPRR